MFLFYNSIVTIYEKKFTHKTFKQVKIMYLYGKGWHYMDKFSINTYLNSWFESHDLVNATS